MESCLPKRHVEVLIPSTRACDFIWKYGLGSYNQVKLRSCWIGVGPKSSDRHHYERQKREVWVQDIQANRKVGRVRPKAEMGALQLLYEPRNARAAGTSRRWETGWSRCFPRTPERAWPCHHLIVMLLPSELREYTPVL